LAKIVEGYLYVYPYMGDDVFIHPEKLRKSSEGKSEKERLKEYFEELSRRHAEGFSLLSILEDLEGKKVRVIIEEKKITIEVLE